MKTKNVLCVIPARGSSKGIPFKNMIELKGQPLLYYSLNSAIKATTPKRIVVSSENIEILEYVRRYGENIALERPVELSQDDTPSLPVLIHALKKCEMEDSTKYEIVILVQATNPLVVSDDIDMTIKKMITTNCDSCFTVTHMEDFNPIKLKKLEGDRLLPYYQKEKEMVRRQDLPKAYIRNGSCYCVSRDVLLSGSMFGEDSRGVVVPRERSIDINEPIDLVFAEALLK